MEVLELIKKTFEAQGHAVEGVTPNPDGSYDISFIGDYGVAQRKIGIFFMVLNHGQVNQRLQQKAE